MRYILIAVLVIASTSVQGSSTNWLGTWVAYQFSPMSPEIKQITKKCSVKNYLSSELKINSIEGNQLSGELIITFGVQVLGAVPQDAKENLLDRCRLPGSRNPFTAERVWKFSVTGTLDAQGRSAQLNMRSGVCVPESDSCLQNAFGWPPGPKDHSHYIHLDGKKLVLDDNKPALEDDYFHYLPVNAYQQLAALGDDKAREFLSLVRAGNTNRARDLLSSQLPISEDALQQWLKSVDTAIGGIQKIVTIWNPVITFPEPNDPKEYIETVLMLNGSNDLKVAVFFFLSGLRNDLRIDRIGGLEYKSLSNK